MSVLREYMGVALVVLSLGLSTGVLLPPCTDLMKENGCHSLQNICSDILASAICPSYCGLCHKAITKPVDFCIDHNPICRTMPNICHNSLGPFLCGKTCHSCVTAGVSKTTAPVASFPSTPSPNVDVTSTATSAHVSAATKPVDTCIDHDPICSTMSDVCSNPLGPALCGKTCHSCVTAGSTMTTTPATTSPTSTPSTTAAVTTTPATTSTATITTSPSTPKAIQRSCYTCGDANTGTHCTIMETIVPKASPCPSDAGFCMTDIFQHTDGSTKYIRRCVHEGACQRQWYEQTSDNSECVDVDPTTLSSDITCRYCCTTDDCNSGNMPARNTLYKPKH
ncbi:protein psiD-like [Haliotis cracherodii]|uniref:protein psiD-like n=1 Tax=Haliotis cracherodii TaxID=6455 RepID=UPI0039EAA2A4